MARNPDNHTPRRTVRIPDDVWHAASRRAAEEHTTVSAVLVRYLSRYAKQAPTTRERVEAGEHGVGALLAEGADQ